MRSERCRLLFLLALCLAGCASQRTVLEQSASDVYPAPDEELDYLDHLETLSVVTNNDALHGFFLLEASNLAGQPYGLRLSEAYQRGWIPEGASLRPGESARVGMIAMAVCNLLEIKGGLSMHLFGPSPRSCTRELVYLELIPIRTENQSLSGLEFIDLLGRMESNLAGRTMIPAYNTDSEP